MSGKLALGAFGTFLIVASIIAALAAVTVLWPHSVLSGIWSYKQTQYRQLLRNPVLASGGFAALSIVLTFSAAGWFRRRRWAWLLASIILGINLLADLVRTVVSGHWIDAIGALVEGSVLVWLTLGTVRSHFVRIRRNK